jgi:hypothetical protein
VIKESSGRSSLNWVLARLSGQMYGRAGWDRLWRTRLGRFLAFPYPSFMVLGVTLSKVLIILYMSFIILEYSKSTYDKSYLLCERIIIPLQKPCPTRSPKELRRFISVRDKTGLSSQKFGPTFV